MALLGFTCIRVKDNGGFALIPLSQQSGFVHIFSFPVLKKKKRRHFKALEKVQFRGQKVLGPFVFFCFSKICHREHRLSITETKKS